MNDSAPRQSRRPKFSLGNLLIVTALIAVGIAVGMAYRKNRDLAHQIEQLKAISVSTQFVNSDKLVATSMANIAPNFQSWQVNVPEGSDYLLQFGIGTVSTNAVPPVADTVKLTSGQHRVTLYTGVNSDEQNRFLLYLDGKQVIEKTMGKDWLPFGWASAGSLSWIRHSLSSAEPIQLDSRYYEPKYDFGPEYYFNGHTDEYVSRPGFRLWIDQPNRTYPPASPFMGFPNDPQYMGIGMRDGLRLHSSTTVPYQWSFTRPSLASSSSLFAIETEFFADDGTSLTRKSQSFAAWQIRNAAEGTDVLQWKDDAQQTTQSAFLHANFYPTVGTNNNELRPVLEFKWDLTKPDEVGMRLADTPANNRINRWRIRIAQGSQHLWRELRMGNASRIAPNEAIESGKAVDESTEA